MLIKLLLKKFNVQNRTKVFDVSRKLYEPRKGLRFRLDIVDEEKEYKENRHLSQNPLNYNFFGNKKWKPRDLIFYTDRIGGKGYTNFAHTSYFMRPYIWGPTRFMFKLTNIVIPIFMIVFFVDFEWLKYHFKKKLNNFFSNGDTLDSKNNFEYFNSANLNQKFDCTIPNISNKSKKKKIGFKEQRIIEYENRIRAYSSPDKIFRYFATLKVVNNDGSFEIFMTPEDFVRSLTPGVMQPKKLGLNKYKTCTLEQVKAWHQKKLFDWVGEQGLLNYGDYLFLMTLLSTPPSEFRLAFYVYDLNGDGALDEEEFSKVQDLVLNQSNVGKRHRDFITAAGSFRKSKISVINNYFFGSKKKKELTIEKYLQFQQDLHRDILRIEFERRDSEFYPKGIISEVSFAELLLLHSNLPKKRRTRMLKRVKKKYKIVADKQGISFDETNDFFAFIYHIDKVDLALYFYKLAGKPLNKQILQKVAKKVTGINISDTSINIVIALFDENGDEQLSQKEFVEIMKKRMQRGLERPKDTGLMRFLDSLTKCSKKQLLNLSQ